MNSSNNGFSPLRKPVDKDALLSLTQNRKSRKYVINEMINQMKSLQENDVG